AASERHLIVEGWLGPMVALVTFLNAPVWVWPRSPRSSRSCRTLPMAACSRAASSGVSETDTVELEMMKSPPADAHLLLSHPGRAAPSTKHASSPNGSFALSGAPLT